MPTSADRTRAAIDTAFTTDRTKDENYNEAADEYTSTT